MAQRALVIPKTRINSIDDTIEIDSCSDETHTHTNTITDHPIEKGANVSDHVRPDQDTIVLNCFVSNTPLSREQVRRAVQQGSVQFETSAAAASQIGAVNGRGAQTYDKLMKLRESGKLVKVVTSLKTYAVTATQGLAIQSIVIQRNRQNYDGLEFAITFKLIRIVRNKQTQQVETKRAARKPKAATGAQVPKDAERKKTAALQLAQGSNIGDSLSKSDNPFAQKLGGQLLQSQ